MGPSASGKSTLMPILTGLAQPTAATLSIDGLEIASMNDRELTRLRRDHIGFVFQFFNLLPMLTAEENVLVPLSIAGVEPDRAWVEELLESVGVGDRRTHRPSEMCGGQQQRVWIARALPPAEMCSSGTDADRASRGVVEVSATRPARWARSMSSVPARK
jgi:putative ABC transport system ATP-binding protein